MFLSEVPVGYFESYCNFLYCVCLIPFKAKRKADGDIVLMSNWKQKVICLALHSLGLFHIFRRIVTVSQENIFSQPLIIFRFASFSLELIMALLWMYSFWGKKAALESLIYHSSHYIQVTYSPFFRVKKILLLTTPILMTILSFLCTFQIEYELSFEKLLAASVTQISPKQSLYNVELGYVLAVIQSIAQYAISLLNSSFDFLAIVISFSLHEFTTQQFNNAVRRIEQMNNCNYSEIVATTRKLQTYFSVVNRFNSPLFFCWFCMALPWLPSRLVENIPLGENKGNLLNTMYTWACFSIYAIGTVFYAEARNKVDQFQVLAAQKILEDPLSLQSSGKNVIKFIKISLKDAVVQGGQCLRVNYSFLGSVLSTLIGYGFLVLQFRISSTNSITKENK